MNAVTLLAAMAIAVGVVGTLLPLVPGLWLIIVVMVVYGAAEGFGAVGTAAMVVASTALAIGTYLGVRIPQRTAAGEGLSWKDQIAGVVLAIAGNILLPVAGLAIGFVAGVFLIRWLRARDPHQAWRSSVRTVGALIRAQLAQFGAAMVMAAAFAVWAWWG